MTFSTKKTTTLKCQAKSNRYWIQIPRCNRPFSWIHGIHQNWPEYQNGLLQFWICNVHKTSINIPPFKFLINCQLSPKKIWACFFRENMWLFAHRKSEIFFNANLGFLFKKNLRFSSKKIWDFFKEKLGLYLKKIWVSFWDFFFK